MNNDEQKPDALSARMEKLGKSQKRKKKSKSKELTVAQPKKLANLPGDIDPTDALSVKMWKAENKQLGKKIVVSLAVTSVTVAKDAKKKDALSARVDKTENKNWGKKLIASLAVTAITVYLLLGVIFGIAYVKGDSMTPAYKNGDLVLFLRIVPKYKIGNVVLVKTREGEENIKRIVGEPNKTIVIDGNVYIDSMKLKETYVYGETQAKEGIEYPLTLSDSEYFVLGDNRENSKDSRNYGPVERKNIRGKALTVLRIRG